MTEFKPQAPDWEARVRDSFARQGIMATLGAELVRVAPGAVEIAAAYRPGLSQQHGFFHAGVTATIADSAGGYKTHEQDEGAHPPVEVIGRRRQAANHVRTKSEPVDGAVHAEQSTIQYVRVHHRSA